MVELRKSVEAEPVEISQPRRGGLVHRFLVTFFTFIVIHYLLWAPVILSCIFWTTYWWTRSAAWSFGVCGLLLALYAPSYLDRSEFKLGRPWDALRHLRLWEYGHEYLGLRIIRTAPLEPGKPVVFGWHPHGIIILSRLVMYGRKFEALFPGIETRALGASAIFKWPGSREISLWLGAVDASPKVADKVLKAGLSIVVYPGGIKEIFNCDKNNKDTVLELEKSKGFVRLAVQHGAPLVPVVVYNERDAYHRVDPPAWAKNFFLKKLRMPLLLFYGRFMTLLPFRHKLGVVFGAPIPVPHKPDATKDDEVVTAAHATYVAALKALWEAHKKTFGYTDEDRLVIA